MYEHEKYWIQDTTTQCMLDIELQRKFAYQLFDRITSEYGLTGKKKRRRVSLTGKPFFHWH